MTNFSKITRNVETLASFIDGVVTSCSLEADCTSCPMGVPEGMCAKERMITWLTSEVES